MAKRTRLDRRSFVRISVAAATSTLLPSQTLYAQARELEPFAGTVLCGFAEGAELAVGGNTCAHGGLRKVLLPELEAGEIPSWRYNRLFKANFADDWAMPELQQRFAPQILLLSEFFRVDPAIKRAAIGGLAAIPAWWPGNRTPGLITIGGDLFAEMQQELPDDPRTGGWLVAALFALAHEFAHSACFAYPDTSGPLKRFPLCFFELLADLCAGAFLQYLVSVLRYNRLDTDSIISYFEARSHTGGDLPHRPDWHGSTRMRLAAVAMGRDMIKSSPQLSGLAILRRGSAAVIKEFDTPELRRSFECAGILWGVPELEEAAVWLVKARKG